LEVSENGAGFEALDLGQGNLGGRREGGGDNAEAKGVGETEMHGPELPETGEPAKPGV
jgi:hypothetical protein